MPRPDDDRGSEPTSVPTGESVPAIPANDVVLRPFDAPELGQGTGGPSRPAVVVPTSGLLLGGEHTTALFHELVEAERDFDDEALIARIGATAGAHELTPLLDEALVRVDAAVRDGDPRRVSAFLVAAVRHEHELERLGAHEARLTVGMALRRLLSIPQLRLVATLLPRSPELRDSVYLVLGRAGEEGADAVIEQLVAAESSSDRRAYFNALVHLQAGVPALVHMLGDPRWYVVRNAAELLGELDARGAAESLERVMRHADERVRRAAATALGRLATPRVGHVLREALRDADPGTRSHAALALAASGWPYASAALRRALADEQDAEVQLALVTALGRAATDDAVDALAELSEPPRGLFRRRGTPLRTAAVRALADSDTPRARDALARLAEDRDPEVREVVERKLRK